VGGGDRGRCRDHHRRDRDRELRRAQSGQTALSKAALTHGYELAYYVFAAVTALAAFVTALMLEPARKAETAPPAEEVPEPGAA
jgi:hypothetical protein